MPTSEVDLHVHSNCSPDGGYSPEEAVKIAKKEGLKGMVVTDHNSVYGTGRAFTAAQKEGLLSCQGVEISTKYKKIDVHILGYSFNFNMEKLVKGLKETVEGYNARSREITRRINEAGIAEVNFDALLERIKNSYVSKPNIAEEIAKQKGVTLREALKFVERGGPGFVPYGDWAMSPQEAVRLIRESRGFAVLAHPGDFIKRSSHSPEESRRILYELIDILVESGLIGLETRYSKHTQEQNKEFEKLAKNKDLLITGGSDWHGTDMTSDIHLGDSGVSVRDAEYFFSFVNLAYTGRDLTLAD